MDETAWFKLLSEQGPLIASLAAFIIAAYTGKIRFAREFKQLEDINTRQTDIVRENSKTTGEAIAANKELLVAMKHAMELLEQAIDKIEHRDDQDRRGIERKETDRRRR